MFKVGLAVFISFVLLVSKADAIPPTAKSLYLDAKKCYHDLDKTKLTGWDRCLIKFEKVTKTDPKSDPARLALFSIARLSQEKYELSKSPDDLQKTFKIYNQFLRGYPKDSMADDALFCIALLRFEKEQNVASATRALEALIQRYPEGDRIADAKALLEKVKNPTTAVIQVDPSLEEEEEPSAKPVEVAKPEDPTDFPIRTIVIDPGHGGEDPGAVGPGKFKEANISLQIARKLALHLKKKYKWNVFLTRTNNKTVSLEARNQFANEKGADLFISIHTNANEDAKVKGVQTFYLNNATSEAATRLAAMENRSVQRRADLSKTILNTMLQNANTDESRDLAHAIQGALVSTLKKTYSDVQDLKVDRDLFYVLVGTKCPSVLVETSFITNAQEERRLSSSTYQWLLADGIAEGIKTHVDSNQRPIAFSL